MDYNRLSRVVDDAQRTYKASVVWNHSRLIGSHSFIDMLVKIGGKTYHAQGNSPDGMDYTRVKRGEKVELNGTIDGDKFLVNRMTVGGDDSSLRFDIHHDDLEDDNE